MVYLCSWLWFHLSSIASSSSSTILWLNRGVGLRMSIRGWSCFHSGWSGGGRGCGPKAFVSGSLSGQPKYLPNNGPRIFFIGSHEVPSFSSFSYPSHHTLYSSCPLRVLGPPTISFIVHSVPFSMSSLRFFLPVPLELRTTVSPASITVTICNWFCV